MLDDLGIFDTERAEKILDNLSQHRLVHDDVLPWPSTERPDDAATIATLTAERDAAVRDAARLEFLLSKMTVADLRECGLDLDWTEDYDVREEIDKAASIDAALASKDQP